MLGSYEIYLAKEAVHRQLAQHFSLGSSARDNAIELPSDSGYITILKPATDSGNLPKAGYAAGKGEEEQGSIVKPATDGGNFVKNDPATEHAKNGDSLGGSGGSEERASMALHGSDPIKPAFDGGFKTSLDHRTNGYGENGHGAGEAAAVKALTPASAAIGPRPPSPGGGGAPDLYGPAGLGSGGELSARPALACPPPAIGHRPPSPHGGPGDSSGVRGSAGNSIRWDPGGQTAGSPTSTSRAAVRSPQRCNVNQPIAAKPIVSRTLAQPNPASAPGLHGIATLGGGASGLYGLAALSGGGPPPRGGPCDVPGARGPAGDAVLGLEVGGPPVFTGSGGASGLYGLAALVGGRPSPRPPSPRVGGATGLYGLAAMSGGGPSPRPALLCLRRHRSGAPRFAKELGLAKEFGQSCWDPGGQPAGGPTPTSPAAVRSPHRCNVNQPIAAKPTATPLSRVLARPGLYGLGLATLRSGASGLSACAGGSRAPGLYGYSPATLYSGSKFVPRSGIQGLATHGCLDKKFGQTCWDPGGPAGTMPPSASCRPLYAKSVLSSYLAESVYAKGIIAKSVSSSYPAKSVNAKGILAKNVLSAYLTDGYIAKEAVNSQDLGADSVIVKTATYGGVKFASHGSFVYIVIIFVKAILDGEKFSSTAKKPAEVNFEGEGASRIRESRKTTSGREPVPAGSSCSAMRPRRPS
jgi:hypothetical protein